MGVEVTIGVLLFFGNIAILAMLVMLKFEMRQLHV